MFPAAQAKTSQMAPSVCVCVCLVYFTYMVFGLNFSSRKVYIYGTKEENGGERES